MLLVMGTSEDCKVLIRNILTLAKFYELIIFLFILNRLSYQLELDHGINYSVVGTLQLLSLLRFLHLLFGF